jgi:6-pyruvoyltetrahydropterin/6-carboxytetrahydropterin synthase
MYRVSVQRKFIANHFLIGGDWGKENLPHAHPYRLEIILSGEQLDKHGYLVDIVQIEQLLDATINKYQDKLLNDFPEFKGINPSLERFAENLCRQFEKNINSDNLTKISVILWENDFAWASVEIRR